MHPEAELVREAQAGHLVAMEALYEAHRSMVYAVALGVCGNGSDADEVLQETFLRAFRSLGDWRGEGRLSTWLYSIAFRTAINWRRRFHPRTTSSRPPDPAPDPGDAIVEQENSAELRRAIAQLPPQQRIVLTLRHLRGLSLAEIAELQECALGTVKSNLHHAIARLKEALVGRRLQA
jgi:RNA polymerase sigma-70 factor (ECF subfamily)